MRRIIERVVTVVTTTTWTISWQDDPLRPSSGTDPAQPTELHTDALPATPDPSGMTETKEADPASANPSKEPKPLSRDIHSYPSKPQRK